MVKKEKLATLALLGLISGVFLSASATVKPNQTKTQESPATILDPAEGNMGYHLMTEDELLLELTPEGQKLYNSLDSNGKALAREVASRRCNNSNSCSGLNACKSDKNDCAGKAKCKGQSKCAFADKNLAVKVVADKMAQKRSNSLKN